MEFKKVFRGYAPKEVDKYIAETAERETSTRRAQKERIDELLEENINLRDRITELQRRQNDVGEVLIVAQKVANDIEQHAKDYADRALVEAKKFYATWQAYSKTIVASFTEDELAAFTNLERKIGDVIANYERKLKGKDAGAEAAENAAPAEIAAKGEAKPRKRKLSPDDFAKQMEAAAEELTAASKSMQSQAAKTEPKRKKSENPISRVEEASGQSIDLRELIRPEQSLEELCSDLGLINLDTDESEDV